MNLQELIDTIGKENNTGIGKYRIIVEKEIDDEEYDAEVIELESIEIAHNIKTIILKGK